MEGLQRTNIYLDEEQIRALKYLAVEEDKSLADLVREAVDRLLAERGAARTDWPARLDALLQRMRQRLPQEVSPSEVESDITRASDEARRARRR